MQVRAATSADASQIAMLIGALGYAISATLIDEKLAAMHRNDTDAVLVAAADHALPGCISLHALPLFHAAGRLGRITSLAVGATHRGQGIGAALLVASHAWFAAAGCTKCEVTSGDQRSAAHRFYESHGYHRDGQRLARGLGS